MASHLSCIGFPVANDADFGALLKSLMPKCSEIRARDGVYLRWSSDCGAEIWLHGDPKRQLTGVTPYFRGDSCVRLGVTARIRRTGMDPLEGGFHAWADPPDENPERGLFSVVFACPDAQCYESLKTPSHQVARVAAFAHELGIHDSPEAFAEAQREGDGRLASRCFIPTGLFRDGGDPSNADAPAPAAEAILTGHVLQARLLTNPLTRAAFWWALVESAAGTWDVVADPAQVDRPLAPGQVLSGAFWLCGRLEGDWLPRRKGMLRWFFGG